MVARARSAARHALLHEQRQQRACPQPCVHMHTHTHAHARTTRTATTRSALNLDGTARLLHISIPDSGSSCERARALHGRTSRCMRGLRPRVPQLCMRTLCLPTHTASPTPCLPPVPLTHAASCAHTPLPHVPFSAVRPQGPRRAGVEALDRQVRAVWGLRAVCACALPWGRGCWVQPAACCCLPGLLTSRGSP